MTKPERIEKLVGLLAIACCWAHMIDEWLHKKNPLKKLKHGRKVKSIFRYGLDHLRNILFNLNQKFSLFMQCVNFLSSTLL